LRRCGRAPTVVGDAGVLLKLYLSRIRRGTPGAPRRASFGPGEETCFLPFEAELAEAVHDVT
jgi:hypothetical protein